MFGRQIVLVSGMNERQAEYIGRCLAACLGVPYTRNDAPSGRHKGRRVAQGRD